MKVYRWLIGVFAKPWAATVPALAMAVFGLVGGYFLWELRSSEPPSGWVLASLSIAFASVFILTGLREAGREAQQRAQSENLDNSIRAVHEVALTMPPRTFLSDFDRLIQRDAEASEKVVLGFEEGRWENDEDTRAFQDRIDQTIRHILDALLDLAWTWDEASSEPGIVYRVNVMWYYSLPYITSEPSLRLQILSELKFHPRDEREKLLNGEGTTGALRLDPSLTTNSLERGTPNPDELLPLALLVGPMLESANTDQPILEAVRARNLPGAPMAVATVRLDYVEDSDEFVDHVERHDLYTQPSRNRIADYYQGDTKGKSIVSFPIRGPTSAAEDEPPVTLGAVNVYRNHAGIMGGAKRAQQFGLMTAPFRHLLFRLMLVRFRLTGGDT